MLNVGATALGTGWLSTELLTTLQLVAFCVWTMDGAE